MSQGLGFHSDRFLHYGLHFLPGQLLQFFFLRDSAWLIKRALLALTPDKASSYPNVLHPPPHPKTVNKPNENDPAGCKRKPGAEFFYYSSHEIFMVDFRCNFSFKTKTDWLHPFFIDSTNGYMMIRGTAVRPKESLVHVNTRLVPIHY